MTHDHIKAKEGGVIVDDILWLMGNKRKKEKRKEDEVEVEVEMLEAGGCVSLYNFRQTCDAFNYAYACKCCGPTSCFLLPPMPYVPFFFFFDVYDLCSIA